MSSLFGSANTASNSSLFGSSSTTTPATSSSFGNVQVQPELSGDRELSSPPEDSISDLSFSPQAEFLAVSSWDKKVRIYELAPNGDSQGKALYEHQGPVLSVHWSKDGTKVVSGGSDKAGRLYDLQSGQSQQIAAHDATIRSVRFVDAGNSGQQMVATASWDKTLKYWDLRSPQAVSTVQLPERTYAMDTQQKLLVVGTAERHICVFDLNNPGVIFKTIPSQLKMQTRAITCYLSANGFAVGSIEGRCAFQYVEDRDQQKSGFSFKCHRDNVTPGPRSEANVYSVNAISIHPQYGTFSTAGSDGMFHFWDKDSKHRLKGYNSLGASIPCTAFNRNGTIFAYALSYDWSKGYQFNTPNYPNVVRLHATTDEEVKPRPPKKR
ncbi:WD40-repeat-containing domain protein [Lipomyces arxii]|uniref:WD40-repeat-containing domain protein n=1 Tax=Lipomyces arxii TaxID=56418 RepID=UPI0034CD8117